MTKHSLCGEWHGLDPADCPLNMTTGLTPPHAMGASEDNLLHFKSEMPRPCGCHEEFPTHMLVRCEGHLKEAWAQFLHVKHPRNAYDDPAMELAAYRELEAAARKCETSFNAQGIKGFDFTGIEVMARLVQALTALDRTRR